MQPLPPEAYYTATTAASTGGTGVNPPGRNTNLPGNVGGGGGGGGRNPNVIGSGAPGYYGGSNNPTTINMQTAYGIATGSHPAPKALKDWITQNVEFYPGANWNVPIEVPVDQIDQVDADHPIFSRHNQLQGGANGDGLLGGVYGEEWTVPSADKIPQGLRGAEWQPDPATRPIEPTMPGMYNFENPLSNYEYSVNEHGVGRYGSRVPEIPDNILNQMKANPNIVYNGVNYEQYQAAKQGGPMTTKAALWAIATGEKPASEALKEFALTQVDYTTDDQRIQLPPGVADQSFGHPTNVAGYSDDMLSLMNSNAEFQAKTAQDIQGLAQANPNYAEQINQLAQAHTTQRSAYDTAYRDYENALAQYQQDLNAWQTPPSQQPPSQQPPGGGQQPPSQQPPGVTPPGGGGGGVTQPGAPTTNPTNANPTQGYEQRGIDYGYVPQNPSVASALQQPGVVAQQQATQPQTQPTQGIAPPADQGQMTIGGGDPNFYSPENQAAIAAQEAAKQGATVSDPLPLPPVLDENLNVVTDPAQIAAMQADSFTGTYPRYAQPAPPATPANTQQPARGNVDQPFIPGAAGAIHNNPENWPLPGGLPGAGDSSSNTGTIGGDPTNYTLPFDDPAILDARQDAMNTELRAIEEAGTPFQGVSIDHSQGALGALLTEAQVGHRNAQQANIARYYAGLGLLDDARENLYGPGGLYDQLSDRYRGMEADVAARLAQADRVAQEAAASGDQERAALAQGYLNRQDTVLDMIAGLGAQERQDTANRYTQARRAAAQNLTSRGLGNTTIGNAIDQSITRAENDEFRRLEDNLSREQAGFAADLSGEALTGIQSLLLQQEGLSQQYADQLARSAEQWRSTLGLGLGYSQDVAANYGQDVADTAGFIAAREDSAPSFQDIAAIAQSYGENLGGLHGSEGVRLAGPSANLHAGGGGWGGGASSRSGGRSGGYAGFRSVPTGVSSGAPYDPVAGRTLAGYRGPQFKSGDTVYRGTGPKGVKKYTTVYTDLPGGVDYHRSSAYEPSGDYDPFQKNYSRGSFVPSLGDRNVFHSLAQSRGGNEGALAYANSPENRHTIWVPSDPIFGLGYSLGGSEYGIRSFF